MNPKTTILPCGKMQFIECWKFQSWTIPKGFTSDGNSSPWWARAVVPRIGKYVYAAFLHDYLLTVTTRRHARSEYRIAMRELGASEFTVRLRYYGIKFYDLFLAKIKD